MHPSVNYDFLIHGDHVHWCDIEAQGVAHCEELAMLEHSARSATDPLAEVGLSILIAMGITMVAGAAWGERQRRRLSDPTNEGASSTFQPTAIGRVW